MSLCPSNPWKCININSKSSFIKCYSHFVPCKSQLTFDWSCTQYDWYIIWNLILVQVWVLQISCLQGFLGFTSANVKWHLAFPTNKRLLVFTVVQQHANYERVSNFLLTVLCFQDFCIFDLCTLKWLLTSSKVFLYLLQYTCIWNVSTVLAFLLQMMCF